MDTILAVTLTLALTDVTNAIPQTSSASCLNSGLFQIQYTVMIYHWGRVHTVYSHINITTDYRPILHIKVLIKYPAWLTAQTVSLSACYHLSFAHRVSNSSHFEIGALLVCNSPLFDTTGTFLEMWLNKWGFLSKCVASVQSKFFSCAALEEIRKGRSQLYKHRVCMCLGTITVSLGSKLKR